MRWLLLIFAPLLLATPAQAKPSCGKGGPPGQGTDKAGTGQFRYSVPSTYTPSAPMPLLFALHGDEGKPDYIYSSFRTLQQNSGGAFILVAPKAAHGWGSWYKATSSNAVFIDAVLSKLLSSYNIDQDRIWLTGWSGGATFLSYYAIKRQDRVAAVIYYLGGGGGGSYSPPPGSCKIPARFVIGSKDFLYSLATKHRSVLQQNGHQVQWVELPGVGHSFKSSTLPATWQWLQQKTLCGKTIPGFCGPPPKPDSGPPPAPPAADQQAAPAADSGLPQDDLLMVQRDGGAGSGYTDPVLSGGCVLAPQRNGQPVLLVLILLLAVLRRRRRGSLL